MKQMKLSKDDIAIVGVWVEELYVLLEVDDVEQDEEYFEEGGVALAQGLFEYLPDEDPWQVRALSRGERERRFFERRALKKWGLEPPVPEPQRLAPVVVSEDALGIIAGWVKRLFWATRRPERYSFLTEEGIFGGEGKALAQRVLQAVDAIDPWVVDERSSEAYAWWLTRGAWGAWGEE